MKKLLFICTATSRNWIYIGELFSLKESWFWYFRHGLPNPSDQVICFWEFAQDVCEIRNIVLCKLINCLQQRQQGAMFGLTFSLQIALCPIITTGKFFFFSKFPQTRISVFLCSVLVDCKSKKICMGSFSGVHSFACVFKFKNIVYKKWNVKKHIEGVMKNKFFSVVAELCHTITFFQVSLIINSDCMHESFFMTYVLLSSVYLKNDWKRCGCSVRTAWSPIKYCSNTF